MFKIFLVLLLVSTPAFAEPNLSCDIKIQFGSYTSGIDAKTYQAVMDKIVATPAVTEKHVEHLEDQGERTLCLLVKPEELDTTYKSLKVLIPAEDKLTWTKITSRTGDEFMTRPPAVHRYNTLFGDYDKHL